MPNERILIVEDEGIVARDIRNRLRRFGYTVTDMVDSGEAALRKAKEGAPNLVLMDIMLKGAMDGTEAAEKIYRQFDIPVVFLTAYADDHTLQRAKHTEPFGYILKPFEERDLQMTIEMALYKHRAEMALRRANEALEARVAERTAHLEALNMKLAREIEERERAEVALRKSEAQLQQAQKMQAVGRLAGGVTHDFNNQLGIIKGYVDMALPRLRGGSRVHGHLTQIGKAVERAAALTHQLLLFSSQQPMNRRAMSLNLEVRELKKMLERLLGEDVAVHLQMAEDLWMIRADAANVDQVVFNLAVNARDAMPEGGRLQIETRNVVMGEDDCQMHPDARPGRFVCLAVRDEGTGMGAEVMAHMFEPFFTTKERGKGTGLGLSVIYGIVQAHDGWITVDSQPGAGSRFEVYWPVFEGIPEPDTEGNAPRAADVGPGLGERILLIEDEAALRAMLQEMLVAQGYRVQACGSVAEARAALTGQQPVFDLILSDSALPDGRGLDLVLEAMAADSELVAVLMTGYPDDRGELDRIQKAGLVLLQKPVPRAELMARVDAALKARRHT